MPQPPQKCECLVLNEEAKVCGELFQPSCVICDFQLPEEVSLSSGFFKMHSSHFVKRTAAAAGN